MLWERTRKFNELGTKGNSYKNGEKVKRNMYMKMEQREHLYQNGTKGKIYLKWNKRTYSLNIRTQFSPLCTPLTLVQEK